MGLTAIPFNRIGVVNLRLKSAFGRQCYDCGDCWLGCPYVNFPSFFGRFRVGKLSSELGLSEVCRYCIGRVFRASRGQNPYSILDR